jgi:uncharacterized membrane protein
MHSGWVLVLAGLAPMAAAARGASIETFNLPGNQPTCGLAIADDGTVVGGNHGATNPAVNFVYTGGQFSYPTPNVPAGLVALTGINQRHVIVGEDLPSGTAQTIGFTLRGTATKILSVPGAVAQAAIGINNSGNIVGWYQTAGSAATLGFIKQGGTIMTLDTGTGSTLPTAINRAGNFVVGVSLVLGSITSWLYQYGQFTALSAPGATATFARGAFGDGWVTGTYTTGSTPLTHGFIYHAGRFRAFDIDGAQQTEIAGANAHGQFTGCYTDSAGTHGFIAH